jgi:hypothetical protein
VFREYSDTGFITPGLSRLGFGKRGPPICKRSLILTSGVILGFKGQASGNND